MLKPSHKNIQNIRIKQNGKIKHRDSLNEANMANIFFTKSAWALAGCPCFILVLNGDCSVSSLSN